MPLAALQAFLSDSVLLRQTPEHIKNGATCLAPDSQCRSAFRFHNTSVRGLFLKECSPVSRVYQESFPDALGIPRWEMSTREEILNSKYLKAAKEEKGFRLLWSLDHWQTQRSKYKCTHLCFKFELNSKWKMKLTGSTCFHLELEELI